MKQAKIWLCVLALSLAAAACGAQPMNLITAIDRGLVTADFHGNGDSSVTGTIQREADGPDSVTIPAGTTFLSQISPYQRGQGGGSGGSQRMMGSRSITIGLGDEPVTVVVAAVCIDHLLRTPGPRDVMLPSEAPTPELARLAKALDASNAPQAALQIAAWTVANDLTPAEARDYLGEITNWRRSARSERQNVVRESKSLLTAAGLAPRDYRLFR